MLELAMGDFESVENECHFQDDGIKLIQEVQEIRRTSF